MTTINPADCKPGPYRVEFNDVVTDAIRIDGDDCPWVIAGHMVGIIRVNNDAVTVLHRLVPEPRAEQMEKLLDGATVVSNVPSTRLRFAAQVVLDLTGDDAARVSALDLQREAADAHLAEAEKCAEDALVEKTAQAIHETNGPCPSWDQHSGTVQDAFRDQARAALAVFREEADQ